MNVLIIDDEARIREVIKEYCLNENYNVYEAENGLLGIDCINKYPIDVIVLDIMMPKMDGFTFFREMKLIKNIPTIVVSARNDEYDKLLGFVLGIDDYLTKPFSPKELIARIKAITKRNNITDEKFIYKDLTIDFKGHSVYLFDKEIKLTLKEYELLTYLIKNKNIVIKREELLSKIWGYDYFGDDRTIDTHIKMLRKSLGKYRNLIITVRGIGYKIILE